MAHTFTLVSLATEFVNVRQAVEELGSIYFESYLVSILEQIFLSPMLKCSFEYGSLHLEPQFRESAFATALEPSFVQVVSSA